MLIWYLILSTFALEKGAEHELQTTQVILEGIHRIQFGQ